MSREGCQPVSALYAQPADVTQTRCCRQLGAEPRRTLPQSALTRRVCCREEHLNLTSHGAQGSGVEWVSLPVEPAMLR
jgi:hypothetical protein